MIDAAQGAQHYEPEQWRTALLAVTLEISAVQVKQNTSSRNARQPDKEKFPPETGACRDVNVKQLASAAKQYDEVFQQRGAGQYQFLKFCSRFEGGDKLDHPTIEKSPGSIHCHYRRHTAKRVLCRTEHYAKWQSILVTHLDS